MPELLNKPMVINGSITEVCFPRGHLETYYMLIGSPRDILHANWVT